MAKSRSLTRFCGAKTRAGGRCRRPAGWGTDHPRRGPCKLHGGSGPMVRRRYAREEAIEQARKFLDEDVDIDPFEAALLNVRIACSVVRYRQAKLRESQTVDPEDEKGLEDAVAMSQRVIDVALKAGIAERLVHLAERAGDAIVAAAEEAIAKAKLTGEQRAAFARSFEAALAKIEEPQPKQLPLESTRKN